MAFRQLNVGLARVLCGRVTYAGGLGFEFWMPASYQRYVYDTLMEAGEDLGLRLFGLHTLNSLRLEKSFGSWAREFRPLYDPFEAGLDRFCDLDRDFIGRNALLDVRDRGPERRLLTWTVDVPAGRDHADVMGDEPIWHNGEVVGWVTSGGYAHASEVSVAMGYVPAALEGETDGWQIEILGDMRDATLQPEPIWDPQATKMRS
ncbi:MAG: glycine cleavage system protein T, partial [Acidimicrobiia bacterium]|nr:glycine cleavage system protein T [Acidimicrobiia bacterium]